MNTKRAILIVIVSIIAAFVFAGGKASASEQPVFHIKKTNFACTDVIINGEVKELMSRTWRFRTNTHRTVQVKQVSDGVVNEFDAIVWPKPGGAWITLHLIEKGKMVVRYKNDIIFKRVIDNNICV